MVGSATWLMSRPMYWHRDTSSCEWLFGAERPLMLLSTAGKMMFRPRIEFLSPTTLEDWLAHTTPIATPRALTASRPIEVLTATVWGELIASSRLRADEGSMGPPDAAYWKEFHLRYPGSSGWIQLSNVGLSPTRDHALLQAGETRGLMSGAGYWVLLRREGGRWSIVQRVKRWIS